MTIKPVLWPQGGKDGRHDVKLYIQAEGKKKYRSTGVKVFPNEWDERRKCVRKSNPLYNKMNGRIERMRQEIAGQLLDGGDLNFLDRKASGSFVAFLDHFIKESEAGKTNLEDGSVKKYRSLRTVLNRWLAFTNQKDLSFQEVNLDFYFSFRDYCIEQADCTLYGGFSKHVQVIKRVMNISLDRELHNFTGHRHKEFKRYRKTASQKIFLTEAEVQRMIDLNLTDVPHLERRRDAWIVSYFLLMRFGDLLKVSRDRFFYRDRRYYYRAITEKKGTEAAVPVKPLVKVLLEKYDYNFSKDSNGEANRYIKQVASLAEINEPATDEGKQGPKWRFITMHTSRRSIATNLKLQGVSIAIIADLGGWKDVASLQRYLRNTAIDAAVAVKDLEAFS